MTAMVTQAVTAPLTDEKQKALRRAQIALYVGAVAAIALAVIDLFVTTTPDEGEFEHAGDYWLTSDGIPFMLAVLALLPALRTLQGRRDGRLGRAGIWIESVGSVILLGVLAHSLIAATGSSLGPTYVLASLAVIVGVILFAIGSRRTGLLPGWLLVLWVIAWILGGTLPILGPGPFLLAAVYVAMAVMLPARAAQQA